MFKLEHILSYHNGACYTLKVDATIFDAHTFTPLACGESQNILIFDPIQNVQATRPIFILIRHHHQTHHLRSWMYIWLWDFRISQCDWMLCAHLIRPLARTLLCSLLKICLIYPYVLIYIVVDAFVVVKSENSLQ